MAPQVWFHVGYPKAASTFLQKTLLANARGLFVEALDRRYSAAFAYSKLSKAWKDHDIFQGIDAFTPSSRERVLEAIRDRVNGQEEPAVISNEGCCIGNWEERSDRYEPVETITKRISQTFPEARILLVLRAQDDWLESWWRHAVRRRTENRTLSQRLRTPFFEQQIRPRLRYNRTVAAYAEEFGPKNVHVLFHSDLQQNPDLFVAKICKLIGIAVPDWSNQPRNQSWSFATSYLKLLSNKAYVNLLSAHGPIDEQHARTRVYTDHINPILRRADHILKHLGRRSSVPDETRKRIQAMYKNDNRELAEILGVKPEETGLPT